MDAFFSELFKALFGLGPGGAIAGIFFFTTLYQTWRIMRLEADRERDRSTWVKETEARQTAFAAVTAALMELRVISTAALELLRQQQHRGR